MIPKNIRVYIIISLLQSNPLHSRRPLSPPGQRPRHAHDDFPFAEAPEVDAHADDVVYPRVGALVQ